VRLFTPLTIRGTTFPNRIVVSPMCQYQARDGFAGDWHFAHYARFAMGGCGLVFLEATAVEPRGRITPGDLGIWKDEQVAPLRRIVEFMRAHGSVPAIQLAHAGRKGSSLRPWQGGRAIGSEHTAKTGEAPWQTVAPSAEPAGKGWPAPAELSLDDIERLKQDFRHAAARSLAAGFEVAEVHGAHGYLLHEFLSPASNRRNDAYGGERTGRMRFPLEVAEIVRREWPEEKPVFFRVSAVDGETWTLDDTVALAQALQERGIDLIDCSAGGVGGRVSSITDARAPGFQVPYAEAVRQRAGIMTMAVGLITQPAQAEEIVARERADLVALGRELLFNPNWPLHAALKLGVDPEYRLWPESYGWWLARRAQLSERYTQLSEKGAGPN
jgi:2,4-dienoyl-CoA reductase-like NADH-dependent reductase (Old Yellow Enzyme family)